MFAMSILIASRYRERQRWQRCVHLAHTEKDPPPETFLRLAKEEWGVYVPALHQPRCSPKSRHLLPFRLRLHLRLSLVEAISHYPANRSLVAFDSPAYFLGKLFSRLPSRSLVGPVFVSPAGPPLPASFLFSFNHI